MKRLFTTTFVILTLITSLSAQDFTFGNLNYSVNEDGYSCTILGIKEGTKLKSSKVLVPEVYEGYTVTYMILQLAIYMGFSKICLLGIDHSYSTELNSNGEIVHKDLADHFDSNDKITNIPQTFRSTLAYRKANEVAQSKGIIIVNSTRGGALEEFQRMSLEDFLNLD